MSPSIEHYFPNGNIPKGTRFSLSEKGIDRLRCGSDDMVWNNNDAFGMGTKESPWLQFKQSLHSERYMGIDEDLFEKAFDSEGNEIFPVTSEK